MGGGKSKHGMSSDKSKSNSGDAPEVAGAEELAVSTDERACSQKRVCKFGDGREMTRGVVLEAGISPVTRKMGQDTFRQTLIQQFREASTKEGGFLDRKLDVLHLGMAQARSGSILHMTTPLSAALCKNWFQIGFLVLGAAVMVEAAFSISSFADYGKIKGRHFRFISSLLSKDELLSEQIRSLPVDSLMGSGAVGANGFSEFELLKDGCSIHGGITKTGSNSIDIVMDKETVIDGWRVATPYNTTAYIYFLFQVWRSAGRFPAQSILSVLIMLPSHLFNFFCKEHTDIILSSHDCD